MNNYQNYNNRSQQRSQSQTVKPKSNSTTKSKKMEFSKFIVIANIFIVYPMVMLLSFKVVQLAELAIIEKYTGALPYLTAIITPAWAAFATVLGFYFNKSKAENKIKLNNNRDC